MEKLVLVEEGIFPITVNHLGEVVEEAPKTGWLFPGTLQGEGKLAGVPSLFIRLAACNLRCIWQLPNGSFSRCDTAYASFEVGKTKTLNSDEIIQTLKNNKGNISHLVISGGEPLLQRAGLIELCQKVKTQLNMHITIETNGTLFDAELAKYIDLASISPKLKNSEPSDEKMSHYKLQSAGVFRYHSEIRKNISVIQSWIDFAKINDNDYQLKFVVASIEEANEIQNEYLDLLSNYSPTDVLLMPLGANSIELHETSHLVLQLAVKKGWRYCSRVHIELFGSKSGV